MNGKVNGAGASNDTTVGRPATTISLTMDDVKALISIAQRAPLENMREAAALSALLSRFHTFMTLLLDPNRPVQETVDEAPEVSEIAPTPEDPAP